MILTNNDRRPFSGVYATKTRYIVTIRYYTDRDEEVVETLKLVVDDYIPWVRHLQYINEALCRIKNRTFSVLQVVSERAHLDSEFLEPEEGDIDTSTILY